MFHSCQHSGWKGTSNPRWAVRRPATALSEAENPGTLAAVQPQALDWSLLGTYTPVRDVYSLSQLSTRVNAPLAQKGVQQGRRLGLTPLLPRLRSYQRGSCGSRKFWSKLTSQPCVLGRFNFDLRVYVPVTSCDPLRIFVCFEGLTHFATSASSDLLRSGLVSKQAY